MELNLMDSAKKLLTATLESERQHSAEPLQIIGRKNTKNGTTSLNPISGTIESNVKQDEYQWNIVWRNVIAFAYLHIFSVYAIYLIAFHAKTLTTLWLAIVALSAGQGITSGAHRLWAHRTYKAKLPLRIFLATMQTMAFQNHLYEWVRDHRVHHKFTETDADPHNANRGFFFSHIGWLMIKKHKDVFLRGKQVDLTDLEADPVVMFQKKYYLILMPLMCFVIPTLVPWYFWNENIWNSWYVAGVLRYTISLNITWLVNSAAHIWGMKPYDKNIAPTENIFVAIAAQGEGWHNYHHVFPWDYKAAELGNYRTNISTAFLDLMAYLGLAYDLKTTSKEMIEMRARRTGDGSRNMSSVEFDVDAKVLNNDCLWGWGDKDMKPEDVEIVMKTNNLKER